MLIEVICVGTDSSQGKGQIISNINACLAVQNTIRSTLGPYGGDLLLVDENGRQTITNDGATVMKVGPFSGEISANYAYQKLTSCSYLMLFIQQHESLPISLDRKMRK